MRYRLPLTSGIVTTSAVMPLIPAPLMAFATSDSEAVFRSTEMSASLPVARCAVGKVERSVRRTAGCDAQQGADRLGRAAERQRSRAIRRPPRSPCRPDSGGRPPRPIPRMPRLLENAAGGVRGGDGVGRPGLIGGQGQAEIVGADVDDRGRDARPRRVDLHGDVGKGVRAADGDRLPVQQERCPPDPVRCCRWRPGRTRPSAPGQAA